MPPTWDLKFDASFRPPALSGEKFAELKSKVLEEAAKRNVRFLAYVIHHGIVDTKLKKEKAFRAAMNTLLYNFNKFLTREQTHGLFVVDRFDGATCLDLVKSIFTRGLDLPPEKARKAIRRVFLMGASCIGAGHLMSLLDIVVGAFRYCVNAPEEKFAVARRLLSTLDPLLLSSPTNPALKDEWGLIVRPQDVRAPHFRIDYRAFRDRFARLRQ